MPAGKVEEEAIPFVNSRSRHIKKRALKNKVLAVTFNEKDLSDFVSGFPKRKKKRRKEAEKKQGEALRRKRLELRKKVDEGVEEHEDDEISETSGTTTYDNGEMKVTVTTHEIFREEEIGASKKHNVPVRKTKPPKKAAKRKSRPKLQRERDKTMNI
ncbi:unnamed protein product [Malus baccata var. baccata]